MPKTLQGIALALAATALFSVASAMIKAVGNDYSVLQILFFRQLVIGLSVLSSISRSFTFNLQTDFPGLHAIRLAGAFTALSAGIWSVSVLPLTTATVLAFTQAFFVILLGARYLGERISLHRMAAITTGFCGVILVIRPSLDRTIEVSSLIAIIGAFGAAVAVASVRKLAQTESITKLLTYQALFVGLLSGVPMIWLWRSPPPADLALLLGIGIVASIGQWIGIMALRAADISVIGTLEYMKLIYAILLGYIFFSEIPDCITLAGAALIISSALYTLISETRHRR